MTVRRVSMVTLLICVFSSALVCASDCYVWQVTKLDQAPTWYLAALEKAPSAIERRISNSQRWRTDYIVNSTDTLVYFRHNLMLEDTLGFVGYPSALYLYGKDTVRLDTSYGGYGDLSFNADSTQCAAYVIESYDPDGIMGQVIVFYLGSRSKEVASFSIGGAAEVEFSSRGWLAYSDWGDLSIFDGTFLDQVFKKGGSYARDGGCMCQHISDIRWSPDGRICVFKYFPDPGVESETRYELYEVYLPRPGAERDSSKCSYWQVRKLDDAPGWYEKACQRIPASLIESDQDTVYLVSYLVSDSVRIDRYQKRSWECEVPEIGTNFVAPGSLYKVMGDSVSLLDSNITGFSRISFNSDSTRFVAAKVRSINDDGSLSDLYVYDVHGASASALVLRVGGRLGWEPQFSPGDSRYIAYADWGDLYIYDLYIMSLAGDAVFQRGGGYAQGTRCSYRGITDIHWSEDGKSLVFKYYPSVFEQGYKLHEVSWSR